MGVIHIPHSVSIPSPAFSSYYPFSPVLLLLARITPVFSSSCARSATIGECVHTFSPPGQHVRSHWDACWLSSIRYYFLKRKHYNTTLVGFGLCFSPPISRLIHNPSTSSISILHHTSIERAGLTSRNESREIVQQSTHFSHSREQIHF